MTRLFLTAFLIFASTLFVSPSYAKVVGSDRADDIVERHDERLYDLEVSYLQSVIAHTTRTIRSLETAIRYEERDNDLAAIESIREEIVSLENFKRLYETHLAEITGETIPETDSVYHVHIWNSSASDRGAKKIRVILYLDNEVVNTLDNITVNWGGRDGNIAKTTVELPQINFDKIEIEIYEWYGFSSSIVEVAITKDRRNVSGDYDFTVNADRINRPGHIDALSDRDEETVWVSNDYVTSMIYIEPTSDDASEDETPRPERRNDDDDPRHEQQDNGDNTDDNNFFGIPLD